MVVFFLQAEEQQFFYRAESSLNQRQAQCSSGELFLQFVALEDSSVCKIKEQGPQCKSGAASHVGFHVPCFPCLIHEVMSVTYLTWVLN